MKFPLSIALLTILSFTAGQSHCQDNPVARNAAPGSGIQVTTLGTGTPRYSAVRSRPATLVTSGDLAILVDAGSGTEHRLHEAGLNPALIGHILFTHHHIDHNAELPMFLVSGSVRQSLESVYGPPGTANFVRGLQDFYAEDLAYRTRRQASGPRQRHDIAVQDLEGGESFAIGGLEVRTAQVNHSIHTVAYRFDSPGAGSVVVSGDLTWSDSLVELAKGADILVIDSGGMPPADGTDRRRRNVPDGQRARNNPAGGQAGRERAHASLEEVARMAREAGVSTLVLTHIGHDRVDEMQVRQRVGAIYGGRVEIASDGQRFIAGESAEPAGAVAPAATPAAGTEGRFTDNGDGTVTDLETGLVWQKSPDRNGDGLIDSRDKATVEQAVAGAGSLVLAGQRDWRLPSITELYSLIDFSGVDPSGYRGTETSGLVPFIDTGHFGFGYGDTQRGERIIDAQFVSSTRSVAGTGPRNMETQFGVNFADGRIKGYGLRPRGREKTFYVLYVRGESQLGNNAFVDNGDGTVTDRGTNLMWLQDDSGKGLDWHQAQEWIDSLNASGHRGHGDWRLPTARELQGIVDYAQSPETTGTAAIDPVFRTSEIVNEAGQPDYPFYWTSDTHRNMGPQPDGAAVYIAFGRAMGYMGGSWVDAHGAGAQRSDPKTGDPDRFPRGRGPQGDAIRINNHVRAVRDAP